MKKAKKAPSQPTAALVISKTGKAPLSKNQQAFNKLAARIEKLRGEIAKKQQQFDEAITLYGKEIVPLEEGLARQSRQLIALLFPHYLRHQVKGLRHVLKDLLQHHLQTVLDNLSGEPDEEIKEWFRQLEGERYEAVVKREERQMRNQMQEAFKQWGVNINFDGSEMSEEELAAKMAEAQQKVNEQTAGHWQKEEARRKTRPKTANQAEREAALLAAEAQKQKSISTIYRQLAKLLHPDLEQDEDRRAEKKVLMQEVTSAYEAKDLHTLLRLELTWIHNQQSHLETVAEEKLALYLQLLREQARELEQEKWQLIHQPRYHVLLERYGYRFGANPLANIRDDLRQSSLLQKQYNDDIEALQTPQATAYLKAMLKSWKEENDAGRDDDLLSMLVALSGR